MHLSAERSARILEQLEQQVASYSKIADAVRARVEEGRELPVEARAADLRIGIARQRLRTAEMELDRAQAALAVALGYEASDRVRAAAEERAAPDLPASEAAAIQEALSNSTEIRGLESALQAEQMRVRSARSQRYPQADLVAQYALMARFNNYEEFFRRFQRNNWQLGVSLQLPLFTGSAASAQAARSELEMSKLRVRMNAARHRIALDTGSSWRLLQNAQYAREVARMDLDVTRERLGVLLAQFEEGRASLRQIEELRSAEMEKWLSFYDAQQTVERLRLDLLLHTGTLAAALR
jgi:outer membrane protein TolC